MPGESAWLSQHQILISHANTYMQCLILSVLQVDQNKRRCAKQGTTSKMCMGMQNKSGKEPGTRAGPVMVAVDAGLLMFGGVASGDIPFAPQCWLLQLGPSPLLGLKDNEVCPPPLCSA